MNTQPRAANSGRQALLERPELGSPPDHGGAQHVGVVDIERDGRQAAVGGIAGVAAVDAAASVEGQAAEGLVALGVVGYWVAGGRCALA
jgi:hypothetical protein